MLPSFGGVKLICLQNNKDNIGKNKKLPPSLGGVTYQDFKSAAKYSSQIQSGKLGKKPVNVGGFFWLDFTNSAKSREYFQVKNPSRDFFKGFQ